MSQERPKPNFCGLRPRRERMPPEALRDADIPIAVESLFQTADAAVVDQLIRAGDRAVPFVVAALSDPRTDGTIFESRYLPGMASPFGCLCRILQELNPPAAALPLAKFVTHRNEEFRKHAALTLGSIATMDCLSAVARALGDEDEYVRSYSRTGMGRALEAHRGEPAFFEQVFQKIVDVLHLEDFGGDGQKLLVQIDRDRAIPILLGRLSPHNPQLRQDIEALNTAAYPIPRETLTALIAYAEPRTAKYPYDYLLGQLLVAYTNNPDAGLEPKLRLHISSPVKEVARMAGVALMVLYGLSDIWEELCDVVDHQGFEALTEPQKLYYAVSIYDGEVCNGGHEQYFGNSSGEYWREAIDGLRAVNAPQRANILDQATQVFGPEGVPADCEIRRDLAHDLSDPQYEYLRGLDQKYYDDPANVHALLAGYVVDHRDGFRSVM